MIDAIYESDIAWDDELARMYWPTDGRVLSGTILVVKDNAVLAYFAEVDEVLLGNHYITKVLPNEVHPFFAGYMMANPWQRVGQAAHNAVDIIFPGLLASLPEGMDIFEVEETDDDRYLAFWAWVATKTAEDTPVELTLDGEGMRASWS